MWIRKLIQFKSVRRKKTKKKENNIFSIVCVHLGVNILRGLVFLNVPNMYGSMKCSVKGRQSYNSLLQTICFYHIKMTFFGEECGPLFDFFNKIFSFITPPSTSFFFKN